MNRMLMAGTMVLLAIPAGAQRPRSDSLPRELVNALLGGSLGSRPVDVHADLADDSLPADLFRDAMLLGFADYRVSRTTVAYFPYAPQATIDTIKSRLAAAGWTAAKEEPDTVRGFVSSYGGARPQAICRGRSAVMPTVTVRTPNRTLAVITRQQGADYLCGRRPSARMGFNPAADSPLPTLSPPAGMRSGGSGSTGAPDRDNAMTMSTELVGSLPFRDIVAHYTNLFVQSGWKKVEEQLGSAVGVILFETTAKGEAWHCALVVSVPSAEAADVHLTLRMK